MDYPKSPSMAFQDSPPSYRDVTTKEDAFKDEGIRDIATCASFVLRFEVARHILPKDGWIDCSPLHRTLQIHSCDLKPCGASSSLCVCPNPSTNELETWLWRSFRLPPRLHYGDADSACKVFASKHRMEDELHALDIPICQHIKLNMPEVAATVESGCFVSQVMDEGSEKFYGDIRCQCLNPDRDGVELDKLFMPGAGVWKHYQRCTACALQGVETAFATKTLVKTHDVKKREMIIWPQVEVRVNLGTLRDSMDPAWFLHAFEYAEVRNNIDTYRRWLDAYHEKAHALDRRLNYQVISESKRPTEAPVGQYRCSVM